MRSLRSSAGQTAETTLGRVWDALLDDAPPPPPQFDPDDLAVIQALYDRDDAPAPDIATLDRMWLTVATAIPEQALAPATAVVETSSRLENLAARSAGWLRTIFTGAMAGFITGFFVLGGGGRIIMRIIAMMSEEGAQGGTTENLFTVGEFTLGGTFNLMLQGGFAGIGAGLVYVAIRRYLPFSGWRQWLAAAAIIGMAAGSAALDNGDNPDYQKFGIFGVNVCLFTLLPVLFGFVIGPVWTRCDRRVSRAAPSLHQGWKIALLTVAMLVSMLPIFMMTLVMIVMAPPMGLLLLAPLAEFAVRRWEARTHHQIAPGRLAYIRFAAVGVPCLIGLILFVLTIQQLASSA